jgi:hypothetical protein
MTLRNEAQPLGFAWCAVSAVQRAAAPMGTPEICVVWQASAAARPDLKIRLDSRSKEEHIVNERKPAKAMAEMCLPDASDV